MVAEVAGGGPGEALGGEGLRLAVHMLTEERVQVDAELGVIVGDAFEGLDDANVDGKLLRQFADEALLARLSRLLLAAGELPVASEGVLLPSLADQDLAITTDQADDHVDFFHGFGTPNYPESSSGAKVKHPNNEPVAFVRI